MFHLYHGKDSFLSMREAQSAIKKLRDKYPTHEYVVIDADTADPETIVGTYETTDMFGGGKVIFIKRLAENNTKDKLIPCITEYLEQEDPNTHIILWEASKLAANLKYVKFFVGKKAVTITKDLNKRSFITWAKEQATESEVVIENDAINMLAQRSNYMSERYINELEKLRLSGLDKITVEDVSESSQDTLETDIWAFIDSVNASNPEQPPLAVLNRLLKQRVDPYFIMAMVIRNTRMLVQCKSLSEDGVDNRGIASTLKLPPFTVPRLAKSSQRATWKKLLTIYQKIYSLDFEIKIGNIDPELGLVLLCKML